MNNLVQISKNNQLTTDSLTLAKVFGKEHNHIIRDIENLDIPKDFRLANFGQSKFRTSNRNGMSYKKYEITRDGFTLLAMGFTGTKAMKFKIDYINAFNTMEQAMLKQVQHDKDSGFVSKLLGNLELRKENQAQKILIADLAHNLLKTKPRWQKIIKYRSLGLSSAEIGRLLYRSPSTISHYITAMNKLGLLEKSTSTQQLMLNFIGE